MKCPSCQTDISDDSRFCSKCGTPVQAAERIIFSQTRTILRPIEELAPETLLAGKYRILKVTGRGGMGIVYEAEDTKLQRHVALKFLPPELVLSPEARERFVQEARAAAALSHPNICTIYEIHDEGEKPFIAMEYIEGQSLKAKMAKDPIGIEEALGYAIQVSEGLEEAHKKGIIHRDIKGANIMVTDKCQAKIMDFGLAKVKGSTLLTREGTTLGTVAYMSPEQALGKEVDHRTDIWSLGVVLYELLSGKIPFQGEHEASILYTVVHEEPKSLKAVKPDVAPELQQIVNRALKKNPETRYSSAEEMGKDLRKFRDSLKAEGATAFSLRALLRSLRRPIVAVPAVIALVAIALAAVWFFSRQAKIRWVREQAIPEISRLLDSAELPAAFRLIRRAEAVLPNDPTLKQIHHDSSMPTSFSTDPPGAEVWATGYAPDDDDWLLLGTTPFTTKELLWGLYRFRIVKPGFQTILGAGEVIGGTTLEFDLDAEGAIPPEMVRVPGGAVGISGLGGARLRAFLIDRYEITNRQFKEFIDRGGYQKREYWKQGFVQGGRELSWEEAMPLFRDSTGRPGPSTWELGEYPQGQDDYPVNGVSWYEAAAYAEFAGKQLPTIYHWQQAARPGFFVAMAELGNFRGAGPERVGSYKGIGAFGTLDMAGNVREWCWNEVGGQRYLRGGAWDEPVYMFSNLDARPPWDRSAKNGIRCVRYDVSEEVGLQGPVTRSIPDVSQEKPVPDEVFRLYRGLYAYDQGDLKAHLEGIDGENSYWKRERVSFAAAYGDERVLGYLYLPKHATPPYQTIIYADPGMSTRLSSPEPAQERMFDFLVKSGRAFLLPVLKGQYQRRHATSAAGPNEARDRLIMESKDFRRSIDYLVSRPDVDRDRLGVFGYSRGAILLPVLAVGEQRLKAAVLIHAGLSSSRPLPEADPLNFLPRFRLPTLMGNSRSDFMIPLETSQRPMFRLLGAPEKDKQQIFWDGGHGDVGANFKTIVKETLDWFDRYLGPVK
jgi:formylglycine-generating enzyme required for sulfatase activity/dienelactone hydrolase/predicted Ser/Thr protein kinase